MTIKTPIIISISLLAINAVVAFGWDAYVMSIGLPEYTVCAGWRWWIDHSGGLLAWAFLAVIIHVMFPNAFSYLHKGEGKDEK